MTSPQPPAGPAYGYPGPVPPSVPEPTGRRTWVVPVITGAAGLALGVLGTLAVTASGDDGQEQPGAGASPTGPATFTLTGTFKLNGYSNFTTDSTAGGCRGSSGYTDIRSSTQVTVYDDKNTVIGTGTLGRGESGTSGCTYSIGITNLPADRPFYAVEVGRRGKITATAAEAQGGQWKASLG
ncbi:hypothetical protein [Streptomyces sp. NPDC089915]|uniref:hypothetical protein n=1 Tax=Streptomyces sp. NPDC089915 TaxID=3155186 RepID=UPI003416E990